MASGVSSTAIITTTVLTLLAMATVSIATSSKPVTDAVGLTSTPIPLSVQIEEKLGRRLAHMKGKVRQYCSKGSVKSQGIANAAGKSSTVIVTCEDEVSMKPVKPSVWHEVTKESGATLVQVE